jgi:hypothetical protein
MKKKLKFNKWTGGTVLAGLSLASIPALGQEAENLETSEVPVASQQEMQGVNANANANVTGLQTVTGNASVSQQFYSKLKHHDFGFSITRFGLGVKAPWVINDQWRLDSSLQYRFDYWNWNFIPSTGPVTSAPWQNINTLTWAEIASYKLDDTWTIYGGGFARSSADSDVGFFKGFTGGGLAGFNYKVDENLSLGAGLAIMTQIKDHKQILPIITAKWKFADDWRLDVGLTDVATQGYGADVKWLYDDAWTFDFGIQYHNSRFRISTINQGVGQEKASLLYAGATWHATPMVDVNGFAGVAVGGVVKAYNNSGSEVFYNKYDPALVIGVKAALRF